MKIYHSIFRIILYTLILLGVFNSSYSKTNNFNYDARNISNYFSGLVSFDDFEYQDSEKFLKNRQFRKDTKQILIKTYSIACKSGKI